MNSGIQPPAVGARALPSHTVYMGRTEVRLADAVVARSRNLRGLLDYGRRHEVTTVETEKDPANEVRGILRVTYANGAVGLASFSSHNILIDWTRNRRSWRRARFVHKSGEVGYFTAPGLMAPEAKP